MPLDGSHFHNWIDYNGVTFLVELLEWGSTLLGHKWRNGARFQNKNQNGLRTNALNKLADGVLNRLYYM